jgi:D-3-phosphoglycerate dehydrogenase
MRVLIADKFEQSGIDGLKAANCDVVYHPDLKDEALASAMRVGSSRVVGGSGDSDARRRCAADCSRRRGLQHHRRRGGIASRHLRLELSGKKFIAVAELTFALIRA